MSKTNSNQYIYLVSFLVEYLMIFTKKDFKTRVKALKPINPDVY